MSDYILKLCLLYSLVRMESFGPLNVMILIRPSGLTEPPSKAGRRLFGNSDELFLQSRPKRGLLTPKEVRSLALAELSLCSTSTVWDVGAGSGSLAIEAARLAPNGFVFAIEMDADDHQLIEENAARFGVNNLQAILGQAPEACLAQGEEGQAQAGTQQ